jgi:hypothetical protein
MPHHPSEEETESNVFDKVAKGNPESNASDHPLHRENQEPVKASAADHKSKGPAIPDSMQTPSLTGFELDADLIPRNARSCIEGRPQGTCSRDEQMNAAWNLGASIVSNIPRRHAQKTIPQSCLIKHILVRRYGKHENEQPLCFRDMTVI